MKKSKPISVLKIPNESGFQKIEEAPEIPLIEQNFPLEIYWTNVTLCLLLHAFSAYGGYIFFTGQMMWQTTLYFFFMLGFTGLGITAASHRFYSHRSYKARMPLRLLLAAMQTYSFQYSIYDWSRTHRVHHKHSETNADPHNVKRGFFFAHMGWLLCKEHPAVREKMKTLDFTDLETDGIIMFQHKYYWPLVIFCIFTIPSTCVFGWGESWRVAWFFATISNFCVTLNMTGLINSAAHIWGLRPYDKHISPSDNSFLALLAYGEGWHNYHHTFPWDYRTDELMRYGYNLTVSFIDVAAYLGLAYDLKTVSRKVVDARAERTGDGTHQEYVHASEATWGWGDPKISENDKFNTKTITMSGITQLAKYCSKLVY